MSSCSYPYCLFCNSGVELIAVGKTVIGRSLLPMEHVNVVNLDSPRCAVSRLQAEIIVLDNGDAWVKDCNSTNGTFINIHPNSSSNDGLRLAKNHYYQLTPGTRLTFGDVEREFRVYSELYDGYRTKLRKEGSNAISSRDTDKIYSHAHDEQQQHCQSNNVLIEQSSGNNTHCRETSEKTGIDYSESNVDSVNNEKIYNDIERISVLRSQNKAPFTSCGKVESITATTAAAVETPIRNILKESKEIDKQDKHAAKCNYYGLSPELLPLSQCAQDPLLHSSVNSNNETCDSDDDNGDYTSAMELKEREVNVLTDANAIKTENRKRLRHVFAEDKETHVENVADSQAGINNEKKNKKKKEKKEDEEEEMKIERCGRTWKWDELKFCLSGMDLGEKTKISRKICKHGACVVDDITDANCLIVHTPAVRTPKVIIAAGRGIPILNSSILSHANDLTLHDLEKATATIAHGNSTYTPELLCQVVFRTNRSLILEGNYYNVSSLPAAVSSVASDIIVKCGGVICNSKANSKMRKSCEVVFLNQKKLNVLYERIMRGERRE